MLCTRDSHHDPAWTTDADMLLLRTAVAPTSSASSSSDLPSRLSPHGSLFLRSIIHPIPATNDTVPLSRTPMLTSCFSVRPAVAPRSSALSSSDLPSRLSPRGSQYRYSLPSHPEQCDITFISLQSRACQRQTR